MTESIQTSASIPLIGSDHCSGPVGGTSWLHITAVIIANMLGLGVLSLPFSASVLGWVPFGALIVLFSIGGLYSGILYARLYAVVPQCHVLADVARLAYGRSGELFTRIVAYVYIGGVTVMLHLTAVISLGKAFYHFDLCLVIWSALICALMVPLLQIRNMAAVGLAAVVGAISIVVPCVIVMVALGKAGRAEHVSTKLFASATHLGPIGVGVMDIIFAFAGQVIFIELQNDMAVPRHFPRSVCLSSIIMTLTYVTLGGFGYYFLGIAGLADENPITSHLNDGSTLIVVNAFLFIHVIVAYVIEANMLCRGALLMLGMPQVLTGTARKHRIQWFMTTIAIIAGAFLLSNLLPFFSDIMGFLASLCAVSLTYLIPVALAQRMLRLTCFERVVQLVILPIAIVGAVLGTIASADDTIRHFKAAPPFSCGGNSSA